MAIPHDLRNERLIKTLTKNLEKRHFEVYYCPTKEDAKNQALALMPEGSSVGWGGSMTMMEIGLNTAVHEGNYVVIDRETAQSMEERAEFQRQALFTDFFIAGTNAVSENGILVNVDGTGNRLAALCYGPKNVIMLVGLNKVAQDLDAAVKRARSYAAPINNMRYLGDTPCSTTGICGNCISLDCICNQVLVTRACRPAGRIKIILIGEEVGF